MDFVSYNFKYSLCFSSKTKQIVYLFLIFLSYLQFDLHFSCIFYIYFCLQNNPTYKKNSFLEHSSYISSFQSWYQFRSSSISAFLFLNPDYFISSFIITLKLIVLIPMNDKMMQIRFEQGASTS